MEAQNELLEMMRKREEDAKKETLFTAIAGGLGTALSGAAAPGVADTAMKQIQDRRKRSESLGDSLAKFRLDQEKAASKGTSLRAKPQLRPTYNTETGRTEYTWMTGPGEPPVPTGEVAGYSPKMFKDEEGRQVIANTAAGLQGYRNYQGEKPEAEQGISPYFKTRSNKIADTFFSSTKADREAIKEAIQGYRMLQMDGTMPKKAALNAVVKMSEGGRMTDEDRNFILGSVGSIAQLQESIKETTDKRLVQRKIQEASELYKEIIQVSTSYLQDLAEQQTKEARSPREKEYLMNKLKRSLLDM